MRCLVFAFVLFASSTALAIHTPETIRKGEYGLPAWCCRNDCIRTDVRLIDYQRQYPKVSALGREWIVIGNGTDGRTGIFIGEETAICPISETEAKCARIKPKGLI